MKHVIKYGILVLTLVTCGMAVAATPAATTLPASSVGPIATLNGSVNPGGADASAWFEWGSVANYYTNATSPVSVGTGGLPIAVSNLLSGLTPGFVYHYRVVASNAFGIARGSDVPFGSPAITLNGGSVVSNGLHSSFVDPGATASNAPLSISGGGRHSLALRSDGTVVSWGGSSDWRYALTNIPTGLSDVVAIAAGSAHNMALKKDGTVVAWGVDEGTNVPMDLSNAVAIAGGYGFGLALKSNGTVMAWGDNADGQTNVPPGLSNVVAIAGTGWHCLALKSDGTVAAWGYNQDGQTNVPFGLSNVIAIAAGTWHSLALKSDGTVVGWGYNGFGQATAPDGLSNVVAVSGGQYDSLALLADGTVAAWGGNLFGTTNIPAGLSNVVAISSGGNHELALTSDGRIVAWGAGTTDTGFWEVGQSIVPAGLDKLGVTVSGSVDTNTPGSYPLTYTSSNSIGGSATITRTVVVVDNSPVINPPVLTGFTTVSNGMFQFGFSNVSGASFTVLATTNVTLPLNLWSNLGPAVETPVGSGQFQFTDPQATNLLLRYYRVRSP